MKNVRQSNVNIHKDAWVEINLESLAQNIIEIKSSKLAYILNEMVKVEYK